MPDDRARVMARVRAALALLPSREPAARYDDDVALTKGAVSGEGRVVDFANRLAAAGGFAFTSLGPLASWLVARRLLRGYCDPRLLAELCAAFAPPFTLDPRLAIDRIDEYDFGITLAAGGIAETGTIILNDALTSRRLGTIAPWVHIAVVRPADIVASVADAIRGLGGDPYVIWCTGPSKTADVEGILIQGVHGPGEQIALVMPG